MITTEVMIAEATNTESAAPTDMAAARFER